MATRAQAVSNVRTIRLDNPYQQAPNLHQIVGSFLQFEQLMANRLNSTGKPWSVKSFEFTSDPDTDTYNVETGGTPPVPITDFGKPLLIEKETGDSNYPWSQVYFDDFNQQEYGVIPSGVSEVGAWGLFGVTQEKFTFYREGVINPVMKFRLNPLPQDAKNYVIWYAVGAIGITNALTVNYAIPEHAHLVEVQTAIANLPRSRWREDEDFNRKKREELAAGLDFELSILQPVFDQYVRELTHARPVEVDVLF